MKTFALTAISLIVIFCCLLGAADGARGQAAWTLTGANTNSYWTSVASSADGIKLAATASVSAGICLSTNSGVTWVTSSAPIVAWSSVASSADGTRLIAAEGSVYISTNSGNTWKPSVPTGNRVASSADGSKLMAVQGTGLISVSTNSGASWFLGTNNGTALSRSWSMIACSADGTKMAAVVNVDDCPVFVSTNCGLMWYQAANVIGQPGAGIAWTADGSKLMLVTAGFFYVSSNWGLAWSSTNNAPFGNSMACSANGSTLMAVGFQNAVDTSTNFGASWVSNNVPTARVTTFACSADGNKLLAAQEPGGIWILKTPPSPQLNASRATNGSLNLSWIVPSTNMFLERSPDLINWTQMTNTPSLNDANLQEQLAISPTNPSAFFRLISQ